MQLSDQLARVFLSLGRLLRNSQDAGALSRPDFEVLARLAQVEGPDDRVRSRDLARTEGLDPSTVSRRIASLAERRLIIREPDPTDGRAQVLSLTTEGRRAVTDERARRVALVTDALAGWDPADQEELARLLGRLSDTLEVRRPTP